MRNFSTFFTVLMLYILTISWLLCDSSNNNLVEGLGGIFTTSFVSRFSSPFIRTKTCGGNFILYDAATTIPSNADSKYVEKEKPINENIFERVQISAGRFIVPGDYVVHEDYGVGRYLGLRYVHIAPASITPQLSMKERMKKSVPVVRVQYDDAEITWFLKLAGDH